MLKTIDNERLEKGMVLALSNGKTKTIKDDPKIGYKWISFRTELGKTRVIRSEQTAIIVPDKPKTKVPRQPPEVHFKGMDPVVPEPPVGGEVIPVGRPLTLEHPPKKLMFSNRNPGLSFLVREAQVLSTEEVTERLLGKLEGIKFGILVHAGFRYHDGGSIRPIPEWTLAFRTLTGLIENGESAEDIARLILAMSDSLAT